MSDTATIGHNTQTVDYAADEAARLEKEYLGLERSLNELIEDGKKQPGEIDDDASALKIGAVIKRFRDLRERADQARIVEKEPHLRRGQAVDAFFNALKEIIQPEDKKQRRLKPGWIDRLQGIIDSYQAEKERKERERLENIRREEQRKLEEARAEEQRLAREAEATAAAAAEAAAAAARARSPERIEEKTAAAAELQQAANQAASAVEAASAKVETVMESATESRVDTFAKSADLVRTRGTAEDGAGVLLTTAKESYAFLLDRSKLDDASKLVLFEHLTDPEVEKALRGWAKATRYEKPMPGCEIGRKNKGITR
jgi:chemotaxis protein histidine kinase CheA